MTLNRRVFLNACAKAGIASPLFPGVLFTLAVQAQEPAATDQSKPPVITPEMIDQAGIIAGIGPFTAEQKQMMIDGLVDQNGSIKAIRKLELPNSVQPAYAFHPLPAANSGPPTCEEPKGMLDMPDESLACISEIGEERAAVLVAPPKIEDLAFATVKELSELLAARKITSLALTKMYVSRLKRYNSKLHFVITLTEERAIAQAKQADAEIGAGKCRGPLHGIPWGAKDLLAPPFLGRIVWWGSLRSTHPTLAQRTPLFNRLVEVVGQLGREMDAFDRIAADDGQLVILRFAAGDRNMEYHAADGDKAGQRRLLAQESQRARPLRQLHDSHEQVAGQHEADPVLVPRPAKLGPPLGRREVALRDNDEHFALLDQHLRAADPRRRIPVRMDDHILDLQQVGRGIAEHVGQANPAVDHLPLVAAGIAEDLHAD